MKVNIDFEGLEELIKHSAEKNVEEAIDDAIKTVAHTYIDNNFKYKIEEAVDTAIKKSYRYLLI